MTAQQTEPSSDFPTLLLVEDDHLFCQVMGEALAKRGFNVQVAGNVDEGIALSEKTSPEFAVVDLNMPGRSGLVLVKHLIDIDSHTRVVMLTGFASIATAVEAIKLGAIHYLAKPVDADEVIAAFYREEGDTGVDITTQPLSVNRIEWEHIQKVLNDHKGNITATARALGMHRRTLQRKLQKRPQLR
ncbi:MAG: response regulator transcription factor [Gammaproteobacteria bacterium]|nr:response regulator transcription factor [Gammaproteobacteria bacterium]MCF6260677.1 response regulator transcription factor [Gammaproteobacteria bacterium]